MPMTAVMSCRSCVTVLTSCLAPADLSTTVMQPLRAPSALSLSLPRLFPSHRAPTRRLITARIEIRGRPRFMGNYLDLWIILHAVIIGFQVGHLEIELHVPGILSRPIVFRRLLDGTADWRRVCAVCGRTTDGNYNRMFNLLRLWNDAARTSRIFCSKICCIFLVSFETK